MNKTKILYLGTPEISAYVLENLIKAGYQIVGVVAQPDKTVGRKQELQVVPTKKVALAHDIPVFQPRRIREDFAFAQTLDFDLIICFSYGQIIPKGLLDLPRLGSLNLHGSLLPAYRGASPIHMTLVHDDKVTGVTLMEMVEAMDAGRMYAKQEVEVSEEDNFATLAEKIKIAASELILRELPSYIRGELPGEEQDESLVTFAPLIKKEQEHLDLTLPKKRFRGWVRALSPEPGGYLVWQEKHVKIFEVEIVNDEVGAPLGTIVTADKSDLILQLSDGQVAIKRLQIAGKRPLTSLEFINGYSFVKGEKWS
ncbi:MAG: methionyl-tRNA formyltransferase [Bacilli bacterium]